MQQRRVLEHDRLQFTAWKRGRAVEGTGLENRRRGNPFVSSNLTASAKFIATLVQQLFAGMAVAVGLDDDLAHTRFSLFRHARPCETGLARQS